MATKTSGWLCTHSVSVDNSNATTAKVTVTCYWTNNGWKYDINFVSAWVYCGGQSYQVKSSGTVDANNSTTQSVSCGSRTFTVNKTTSSQSISCYAKITSNSSYVSGTKSSSATNASVTAKTSYKVTYNANGGSGAPSAQTKWYGTNLTLSSTKPTRTGYTFKGWGTSSTATSVSYNAGGSYSSNANITLYAIWTANTYTVTFKPNGGTGGPSTQTKTHGVNLTLSTSKPTRTNYTFKGWGISASATTVSYASGGSYTDNKSITLYAIWELAYTKPRVTNVKINRCDSDLKQNDEGTYFVINFNWATDKSDPTYMVEWKKTSESWSNAESSGSKSLSGTSGTNVSFNTSGISLEKTYNVRLTVTDSAGKTEVYVDVPSLLMALDVYPASFTYLHLESTAVGSNSCRIYYATTKFTHVQSTEYTVSFAARSSTDDTVLISNVGGSYNQKEYSLSTDWQSYSYTYIAESGGSLTFWLKDANTSCDIMNLKLTSGGTSLLAANASTAIENWTNSGVSVFRVDVENNGIGVAIGKTAEVGNLFDVAMFSRFRSTVCIGDKTGYLDGNTGVYLNKAGYMHLQRDPSNGHPYIGFLTNQGADEDMAAFIRYNEGQSELEFLNAPRYRFSRPVNISADAKIAHNDGKTGWYFGQDGTAHVNAPIPGIYFHNGTSTTITSSIKESASGTLTIGNKLLIEGSYNVLWSGGWFMKNDQVVILSESISSQTNGILLVFSRYSDSTSQNYHFNTHFISKRQINKHGGCGHSFMLTSDGTMSLFATKYLYIHDTQIVGNDVNDDGATTGACGIKYTNNGFVLRYVYGV